MTPSELVKYLGFAIQNRFPVLVKGRPGIGKSDIMEQAARNANARLITVHPVVSDPTDFKGLPFATKKGTADFLPFGELQSIIEAKEKTIFFMDDLGQAPPSVQAACMQLLLARRINSHKVSDSVVFMAATNRRQDKAGVMGLLEPIKSRFASIIELEVSVDDWINWALNNRMPTELIGFVRFKPSIFEEFKPNKDLVNSPSPRTIAFAGSQQAAGLTADMEFEVFKGAAGEEFATEYVSFLKLYRELPSLDEIILSPRKAPVPKDLGTLYALASGLAYKMTEQNISSVCTYLNRLPVENAFACMQDAITRNRELSNTRPFIQWSVDNPSFLD